MGNDGGSIPKRRELVKEAARIPTSAEIKESQQEQQEYRWTTCPLSLQPLKEPIVSDSTGILYNKDAIIEYLLPTDDISAKSNIDKEQVLGGRVRSLRDVIEIRFHVEVDGDKPKDEKVSSNHQKWVCPITNKLLGAGAKAAYVVPCGHAFSESAVREIPEKTCLECNEPFTIENIITILPVLPSEKKRLTDRSQRLREQGLTHSLKKVSGSGKKRKKRFEPAAAEGLATSDVVPVNGPVDSASASRKSSGTIKEASGIKNAAAASLTAEVLAEEQEKAKRRKLGSNDNLKSLFSTGKTKQKDGDFMTRGFSIPAGSKH